MKNGQSISKDIEDLSFESGSFGDSDNDDEMSFEEVKTTNNAAKIPQSASLRKDNSGLGTKSKTNVKDGAPAPN